MNREISQAMSQIDVTEDIAPSAALMAGFRPAPSRVAEAILNGVADGTQLQVRLKKTRDYVLCGRISCRPRFARVVRFTEVDRARAFSYYVRTGIWTNLVDHIQFLPGWAPERTTAFPSEGPDFIWRFSTNARKRVGSGRGPALRRYPKRQGHIIHNDVMDPSFVSLPTRAVCPRCHQENAIVAEAVGVGQLLLLV